MIVVFALTSLLGQVDSSTQPPFVASIKPSAQSETTGFGTTLGRFLARGVTAKYLVAIAYGLQKFQITGGERWVDGDRFDVEAKLEESNARAEKLRELKEHGIDPEKVEQLIILNTHDIERLEDDYGRA